MRKEIKRKNEVSVQSVAHLSPSAKFSYAIKVYNCMWINPVFEDIMPLLELLKKTAIELSDLYLDEMKRDSWETMEKLHELDCVISILHKHVENIQDKASAFIRSAGMETEDNLII